MREISSVTHRLIRMALRRGFKSKPDDEVIGNLVQPLFEGKDRLNTPDFRETIHGKMYLAGLHKFQEIMERSFITGKVEEAFENIEAIEPPPYELFVWINTIGELMIQVAGLVMPPKLKELAKEWSEATADRQRKICEEVYQILLSENLTPEKYLEAKSKLTEDDPESAWMEDLLNQPVSRIFGLQFNPGKGGDPNCFAKGQMLTAFTKQAGAEVLGVTPLLTSMDFLAPHLDWVISAIKEYADEHKLQLSDQMQRSIKLAKLRQKVCHEAPNRFHMAVALKLKDDSWYIIDPHMSCGGTVAASANLDFHHNLISTFEGMHPGFTQFTSVGEANNVVANAWATAEDILGHTERLRQAWQQSGFMPQGVIPALAASPVIDLLLEAYLGKEDKEKFNPSVEITGKKEDGNILAFKLEGTDIMFGLRDINGEQFSDNLAKRIPRVIMFLDAITKGEFTRAAKTCDQLKVQDVLKEGMTTCIQRLMSLAYREALSTARLGSDQMGIIPPYIEVYEPCFRAGVETLTHLNTLYTRSNQAAMELAEVCGGQLHLQWAAAEPMRTGDDTLSPVALSALKLLCKQRYLLPDAHCVVIELSKLNLTNFPKEGEDYAAKQTEEQTEETNQQLGELVRHIKKALVARQSTEAAGQSVG